MDLLKWLPMANFIVLVGGLIYTIARVNLTLTLMKDTVDDLKMTVTKYNERLVVIETTCKLRTHCELLHRELVSWRRADVPVHGEDEKEEDTSKG